jgi:hypothetical protein
MPIALGPLILATSAIGAATAVGGAAIQAGAARDAASASNNAARRSLEEQKRQYDLTRADQEPWRQFGQNALGNLSDPNKNFQASPDYQFRLSRGLEGVTQNRAVNGLLQSGSALKGLNDYAAGSASQEFGNWYNRQMQGAGLGSNANAANQQAGQNYANNATNIYQNNAQNQMNSSYNQGNAWTQAFGQIGGMGANALVGGYIQNNYTPSGQRTFAAPAPMTAAQSWGLG